MLTLRSDQRKLMDAASAQMKSGHRRVLIQAPTGFGKIVLTSSMMGTSAQRGFHSVFIVHRRELLAQASAAFTSNGVAHGVIAAGVEPDFSEIVHVATIGSLVKYLDRMRDPALFVGMSGATCRHRDGRHFKKLSIELFTSDCRPRRGVWTGKGCVRTLTSWSAVRLSASSSDGVI